MPRVKDIAWKFVIRLEGDKWRCPHCENEYSGKVTRVKSHFLKQPLKGISPCKKVPEHISTLMHLLQNQVRNKDDIAWKFINRLAGNKWRCHYCSEEFSGDLTGVKGHLLKVPNEGISICPKVPDHVRKLMRSLLDEVAEEESREANGQSSTEPQSCDLPARAEVAEEESREANGPSSTEPESCDLPAQAEVAEEESKEAKRQLSTESPLFSPEFLPYMEWLEPDQRDVTGLNSDQQSQAEHRFHQSSTVPSLVQNSHAQPALVPLQHQSELLLLDQPTHLAMGNEPQNSRGLSQYDQVLVEQYADGISKDSSDWSNLFGSLPESRDVNVNTPEEIQMNEQHNPTAGSSLQNDSSLDVDSTNCSQDGQPCLVEVVPVLSPTNTVQHPDQLHPRCDKENGNDAPSYALQTPMDIDLSLASQHTADCHIIKATTFYSQIPEVATNATGPSSLQDMNRGSPILKVQSIYSNDEEIKKLKRKVEELYYKEADIKEQMEIDSAASSVRKKPRILVEKCLKETKRARNKFKIIDQAIAGTLPPKGEVETLTGEVEKLIGQTLPQPLLMEASDARVPFQERKIIGEKIHRNIELIWERLKGNHGCKLGICGMGGVGKTAIVMHVHNRLLEDASFDGVLFIEVSQDFSIYKLQNDIWKALNSGVMKDEHKKKRPVMLSECLKRKKNCVLILDDVWKRFKLQDVGIPDRDGPKVVLTTRSSEVCSQMNCEEITIQPLGEEEAWELFKEELGPELLTNEQIGKVARKIANRCAGLPLAINTMASSMKGEDEFPVWRDTLNNLEESRTERTEMGAEVLPVLRLSYERLSDSQVNQCFVFCALFPEDEAIRAKELIEYFIDEGFLDELDTREEQYCRGLTIVAKLRNACLLEVDYHDSVRMHDLIRDMALHIC